MLTKEEIEKIEKQIRKQKYIRANADAKITRLSAQLETGVMKKTKSRVKVDQKPVKTTPKADETPKNETEKESFFDKINPFNV